MFRSLALASLALVGASALSIARAEEKPVVIGTGTMDLSGNGIAIDVSKARGAFRGIRLLSKSGTANLKRIQIIYNDGAVLNEDHAMRLVPGERSEVLGDTGRDRFIDAVNITNEPGQGKAVIEVVGVQATEAAE